MWLALCVQLVRDTAGTFSFFAPECCTGEAFNPYAADVWAAAVSLYCFAYGRLPFLPEGKHPYGASMLDLRNKRLDQIGSNCLGTYVHSEQAMASH
jgi:serine/threonine protein kinase